MLSELFGAVAGRAHMPPEDGWESYSAAEDPDDYCAAEWADVIIRARRMGVEVDFSAKEKGIKMLYGDRWGLFKDRQGGVKLASQFLDSL